VKIPLHYIHLILQIHEEGKEALVLTEGDNEFEKYSTRKSYIRKQ